MKRWNGWAWVLVVSVAVAACGGGGGEIEDQAAPEAEPADGDMLVVGMAVDLDTAFPPTSNNVSATDVTEHVFWYLMRSAPDFINVIPGLADSFRFTPDSLSIDFFINPDANWHDGHPVTAEDVVFGMEVCQAPEINFSAISWLEHITDTQVIDDKIVRFTFDEQYMYMVQDATVCWPMPKHILGEIPWAEMPNHEFTRQPIGNGPFKFVSWTPNQEAVLEANTEFFRGRPHLNRVVFRVIPEDTNLATQLQNGDIDVWPRFRPPFYPQISEDPDLVVHSYPGRSYTYLAWNTRDPLFSDVRVRQALTMAIDRQEIVDALLYGQATVGTQPFLSTIWAHDETIEPWPYDPEQAAILLAEAGWTDSDGDGTLDRDGQPFSFRMNTNGDNTLRRDILTVIQEQLGAVGVEVVPELLEFNTFIRNLMDREFQAAVAGWSIGIKAELQPVWGSGQLFNFTGVESAELDSLIQKAELERDREKAKAIWSEAQRMIVDGAYYTFLFQLNELNAVDQRFQDVEMTPYSWLHFLEEWFVPEGRQKYQVPVGDSPVARLDR